MDYELRLLADHELAAGGGVAARALRDDPLLVFLHGDDPIARMRAAYAMFVPSVTGLAEPPPAAVLDEHVIAVAGVAPPGTCFVTRIAPELTVAPVEPLGPPGAPDRLARVMSDWVAHHTDERHWHVGPVAVEPGLQGRGIGRAVMGLLCERLDAEGEVAWLETEKPENVVFYRRLAFEVVSESDVHGMHTWFMRREPR